MNKKLLLVFIFTLTSCTFIDSSNEESNLTTSFDVFSYYQNEVNKLEEIKNKKANITNKNNSEVELLTEEYWNTYASLISFLQDKLSEDSIKDYFVSLLGKEKVNYILDIDTSKIFYKRKYSLYDESDLENIIKEINLKINLEVSHTEVIKCLEKFILEYENLIDKRLHINLLSDLYLNNIFYQNEKERLDEYYLIIENKYKEIFKTLLKNQKYSEYVVENLNLDEEDISYFLDSVIYEKDILELFTNESELENKYLTLSNNKDKLNLYVELVNIRNQISNKLGYSSYLDYVYKEVYKRNYTLKDVSNLISNIFSSSTLKKNYLYYSYLENNSKYYFINEYDLLSALDNVGNFIFESKDIIKELKTYGFYNFDYRNNKYKGSYKTYLNIKNNEQFILLNVNNNINDYLTLFHEFGHYLGDKLTDENRKGNKFDLDIAEVHSQGLEYIMSNFFSLFLKEEESKELMSRLTFNALWTLYSSALVSLFEEYVYINLPTKEEMVEKFDDLIEDNLFPLNFGMEEEHYLFTNITHIFTSPGYYISYLTSIIPSLVLWSNNDINLVRKQYKTILSYGTSNDFIYVLNQVNLPSPFEKESIKLIENQIDKRKKEFTI